MLPDGNWTGATLVNELNAAGASDARPHVRKDGLEVVFDSTRGGGASQIYTAHRSRVHEPWSVPVPVTAVNATTSAQSRPTISKDGTRLYFGSTRAHAAGQSGGDIFVSTRSREHGK